MAAVGEVYETNIPNRLDRLPWSGFHWLVIGALGIAWILDGLEVTIVGSLSGALSESPTLQLTAAEVGASASTYLVGAVAGAVFFGWLTDRLGRKKLFTITVLVYLVATIACGLSWNFWSFALFRMMTGAGIGGEYAAVNATIQEMIPARRRGFTDLVVNGSFWLGAALGAMGAYVVLDPAIMPPEIGWRAAFVIGGVLGFIVLFLRQFLPESPRWLMTHGQPREAERVVAEIEQRVERETGKPLPPVPPGFLKLRTDVHSWFTAGAKALVTTYRRRTWLGVTLMAAQAFCYNAVFFTYALILTRFYDVASGNIGLFILPFALGQFHGSAAAGPTFRYPWAARDDHRDLRPLRGVDGNHRLAIRNGLARRGATDACLDDHLLLCLGCRQFGLPDHRRKLSAGGAGDRHRLVLRVWHGRWRRRRPGAVRSADRDRIPRVDPVWLSARRRVDGRRCRRRGLPKSRR